jgi:hypothetical protein
MIGQAGTVIRSTPRFWLLARPLRRQTGLGPGDISVEALEAELQLVVVEALRPASEAATLQDLGDLPQPVDLGLRRTRSLSSVVASSPIMRCSVATSSGRAARSMCMSRFQARLHIRPSVTQGVSQ